MAYAADPTVEPAAEAAGLTAPDGADVISCSLGPNGANWPMYSVLMDAIDAAVERGRDGRGTPVFWAASNGNVTIDGFDGTDEVASYVNTIAVGRSRRDDTEDGSAYGPGLDFLSPGVDVYSTTSGGRYRVATGTSYATPLAAGVAALVLSVNDDLRWDEIRTLMRATCEKVGDVSYVDGRHDRYGYGRLNAAAAVREAATHVPLTEPSIRGPATVDAAGDPPTFEVSLAGNYYYQVELTTQAELFDYDAHGNRRTPETFYPMWDDVTPPEEPPLQTGPSYRPPAAAWKRLLASRPTQVFYRMHSTSRTPDDNWEPGYHNTTPDEHAASAHSIDIVYDGARDRPTASVGVGGDNRPADVRAVKRRLVDLGFDWLDDSGSVDDEFVQTIRLFQSIVRGRSQVVSDRLVDGRVDVPGFTYSWLMAANAPRWQRMPAGDAEGTERFYNVEVVEQDFDDHEHGTDWMATVIRDAGRHYRDQYLATRPEAAPLTVNDVSRPHGGNTPDHSGHETGLSADLRLPRVNGTAPGNTTFRTAEYDREAMRAMLRAVRAQPGVRRILFNDPELTADGLCQWAAGHDDHAHVDVELPERYERDVDAAYERAIEFFDGRFAIRRRIP